MIAVTGIGLVTAAGIGAIVNWRHVCQGLSATSVDATLAGLPVDFSCHVPDFDPALYCGRINTRLLDRHTQLALAATREAVTDSGLDPQSWNSSRAAVVIGSAAGGVRSYEEHNKRLPNNAPTAVSGRLMPMFMPNMTAAQVAIAYRASGPNMHVGTACASGASAIATATQLLRMGMCDLALAGGAESMTTPLCVQSLLRLGVLTRNRRLDVASRPFDQERDGFVMGEGAAILVLERANDASARNKRPYALIAGYGASSDAHHAISPDPLGGGTERAIRAALSDAGLVSADIDYVNAHGACTQQGDLAEGRAIERLMPHAVVSAPKSAIGHTFGAAGAIDAVFTALTIRDATVPPTVGLRVPDSRLNLDLPMGEARRMRVDAALSASSGMGGPTAALVFRSE